MKTLLITTSTLGLIFTLTTTYPVEATSEANAINPNQQGKIILARGRGNHWGWRHGGWRHRGWHHWYRHDRAWGIYGPAPFYSYPPVSYITY